MTDTRKAFIKKKLRRIKRRIRVAFGRYRQMQTEIFEYNRDQGYW